MIQDQIESGMPPESYRLFREMELIGYRCPSIDMVRLYMDQETAR